MKKLPLVICAPHACVSISSKARTKIALSDYEIWKYNDPFTEETSLHPNSFAHIVGNINRICCDLSFGESPMRLSRKTDFYGNNLYLPGKSLTREELANYLEKYAKPYRESITAAVRELQAAGHKKILVIDHHNTAGDHPVGRTGRYMPMLTVCNGEGSGNISCPTGYLQTFARTFKESFGYPAEINDIYSMGHTIRWLVESVQKEFSDIQIHGFLLEYNLNIIHNSVTKKNDLHAKEILLNSINSGINAIFSSYFSENIQT
ncbi:MAG: N-formylglutamate amidohydrolase [bacterium]|nr:N-formylglutamate amidohydrolase [bacterium]